MGISLYDATVGGFIQTVAAVESILAKGLEFAKAQGIDPNTLLEERIHPDMFPLSFQLHSVITQSINAVEAARAGQFSFTSAPPRTYEQWQQAIAEALAKLKALPREDIDALVGREVEVKIADPAPRFTAEAFLLSMVTPNFHFHATTAYDILRKRGVPVGKRDYLGQMRFKF